MTKDRLYGKTAMVTGQVIFVDGGRRLMEQDYGPDHNY
jgi:hypothetical protein